MSHFKRRAFLAFIAAAPLAFATKAQAAEHVVVIKNFAFDPPELNVAAGDTVIFVNEDGAPHTATAEEKTFNTGTLKQGQAKEIEMPAGTHEYFCRFHRKMTGVIIAS